MTGKSEYFGEHLLIDAYGANRDALWDKELIRQCLKDLCGLLGVKILCKPVVTFTQDGELKVSGGVTGVVVLAESHISIHAFPSRRFLSADVYSCKHGMDQEAVKQFFVSKFGVDLGNCEIRFIRRGTRYPAENIA
ncbi:hypothetical protein A3A39_03595 [Candidatus Kaiserbacteria bacterium RIFCSPLOWO2_01_FULL_54_13]|uniref:S-adenosylmethionine decarboxylase proenzyme n=1 Tax=Candidatus Kaiserbacteria bacterium RIFCSPLOWO2_01_FULL_54_13 TaxID=1798512 RepID=A0A1F6EZY1_9BACT|nr:MAG: hypothetical protein A3A39_03595 [Candidatus Kaiserbacteria bacterium RIFCSPLOWO2_01_FULL_54_13]